MDRLPSSIATGSDALSPDNARWLAANAQPVEAVDAHAHVFVRGLPLAAERRHAPDYDATLDDYVSHLRANGLSHAVLVQPSFLGTDNGFFLDVLKRYPRRFRGVAVIEPEMCESVCDRELASMHEAGVVGIRLNLIGRPLPDLRDGRWPALLARVNALGWHVEIHRGAGDLGALLPALIAQQCTVVIDHFGRPDPTLGAADPGLDDLCAVASTGQVWVKLSAAYRNIAGDSGLAVGEALTARMLDAFGPTRLVWGSDWPHTQHREVIDYDASRAALNRWIPDAFTRQIVLRDSARALFRFG
ncbi:amidohydrolase family protein [Cupriavidus pauculus]|uniref:Amidohydrolase family protein n=1 Tax=Cupriavidus pauculus TaxID=82633 RepID=A0A5P2H1A0_9BURK|nr:amidohydrolase family protein [Cupriavidus pauculus]QET01514.1 amidohydrolase family protein [Cupriavidus pauculus]